MKIKAALGTLLMASLTMCSTGSAILEVNYVQHLQVRETHNPTGTTLHVSGLCGHSSYVVKNLETTKSDHALILDIHIAMAKDDQLQKGFTGNFSYAVPVPEDVDSVLLGEHRTEIWSRSSKSREPQYATRIHPKKEA
jgi:hypothetical protein